MPKDKDFLKIVYADMKEDLRCRRNFESQLVHYFFLFHAIVGIAIVSLFEAIKDFRLYLAASVSIALFIILVTVLLIIRVKYDHGKYVDIGEIVQRIWTYYKMFEEDVYLKGESILDPKKYLNPEDLNDKSRRFEGYGRGEGYRYTCCLLGLATAGMIIFISMLVGIKLLIPPADQDIFLIEIIRNYGFRIFEF
ncbi:MAG: hypothetical protein HXS48_21170 [Theionarchaea archaeon]|nr:hypothetical protein [Theionarchaea archaeon]